MDCGIAMHGKQNPNPHTIGGEEGHIVFLELESLLLNISPHVSTYDI